MKRSPLYLLPDDDKQTKVRKPTRQGAIFKVPEFTRPKEAMIAVLGSTGAGKTTFINTASGSKLRVGIGLKSCTDTVETSEPFELNGHIVTLLDTPGFDDTTKSSAEILDIVYDCLLAEYNDGHLLNGAIHLHPITDNRLSGGDLRNFRLFEQLCGVEAIGNSAIVTNMWNLVDEKLAAGREEELRTRKDCFGNAIEKGSQFIRNKDDTRESAHEVLSKLIKNKPLVLGVQKEPGEQKTSIASSTAGETLLGELAELTKRHGEEMRDLEADLEEAERERDVMSQKELEDAKVALAKAREDLEKEKQRILDSNAPVEVKKKLIKALSQRFFGWLPGAKRRSKKNKQKSNEIDNRARVSIASPEGSLERVPIEVWLEDTPRTNKKNINKFDRDASWGAITRTGSFKASNTSTTPGDCPTGEPLSGTISVTTHRNDIIRHSKENMRIHNATDHLDGYSINTTRVATCMACNSQIEGGPTNPNVILYCNYLSQQLGILPSIILRQFSSLENEIEPDPSWPRILTLVLVKDVEDLHHTLPQDHKFLRYVQQVLDLLDKMKPLDGDDLEIRLRLSTVLLKLSMNLCILPLQLLLEGVECDDKANFFAGGYADVFRGTYHGEQVALKRPRLFMNATKSEKDAVKRSLYYEASIWATTEHPNILKVLGINETIFSGNPCVVLPWMDNGSIRSFILELKSLPDFSHQSLSAKVAKWLRELALGLQYLHMKGITHGDLRTDNVLLDKQEQAHITDFGLAVFAQETSRQQGSLRGGNERWMAPELLAPEMFNVKSTRPTPASDIYSFGCLAIELFTSKAPFEGQMNRRLILRSVPEGARPARPQFHSGQLMSDALWEVVCRCWEHEPSSRPSADELVSLVSAACPGYV